MAKKGKKPGSISNRRARYDYELGDSYVVGLALSGPETKALRLGHASLTGAYVTLKDGELWLINAQVMPSAGLPIGEDEQMRSRKLLAKKSEIEKLAASRQAGNTIVPLEILNRGHFIKLRLAVGRGKKRYDKREIIKRRQHEREAKRSLSL